MSLKVFKTTWCHKCRELTPYLQGLNAEIIDADLCSNEMLDEYNVNDLPCIVYEKENGEKLKFKGEFKNLKEWANGIKRTNA